MTNTKCNHIFAPNVNENLKPGDSYDMLDPVNWRCVKCGQKKD